MFQAAVRLSELSLLTMAMTTFPFPFPQPGDKNNKCDYNGWLYFYGEYPVSISKCRDLNANLLVFDSNVERVVATKYLQDLGVPFVNSWFDSIWIGASAQGTNRRFVLSKNGAPLSYARWCFNQPDFNHRECVAYADFLGYNFGYHDFECLGLFPFVCENSAI
ncbi:uncharacterized protein Dvir_GJ26723 [Drosophila virilis]|uniref:C-type lectin domain-containing protein n=1 Tax=Drosophila virilis TaxID=7244 RepID=A0A0Q9W9M4_DROVI|nr:uncharacterized protein Dvir_GJ26723 [Drosophila virilis]